VVTIAELVGAVTGIGHQLVWQGAVLGGGRVRGRCAGHLLFLLEAVIGRWNGASAMAGMMDRAIEVRGLRKVRQTTSEQSWFDRRSRSRHCCAGGGDRRQTGCGKSP
jgi:hypothetical protein